MTGHRTKSAYRMLLLIATPKLVKKAEDLLKQEKIPVQHLFHAQGTATSEVMDMLGLDGIDKTILMSMMPKVCADDVLKKCRKSCISACRTRELPLRGRFRAEAGMSFS